jgi:GT2 family glycosyltransferase
MSQTPKIGIVYLLYYHNKEYVDDMVGALKKVTYPKDKIELIIVANPHNTEGSFVYYLEETVMPYSEKELPRVTILPQEKNLGFGPGNNAGADWALEHGCDYVFYHNNDGFFAANALEPLIQAMESDKTIGMAQSLMLLHPETELLNSAGNSFHYLGFGFCDRYRESISTLNLESVVDVDYASGAALLVRADVLKKHGGWDNDFFMYHEDLEWALRLRTHGYRIVLVRDSIFYHKYQFGRSIEKFFWMERNRHAVMLMFFKWPTLILLFPMAFVLEVGLWYFSFKRKYTHKKWAVYAYWWNKENRKIWLKKRKKIQSERMVSDRYLLSFSVSEIKFQEAEMRNILLEYVGNPIMKLYYYVVVKGLIWW